MNPRVAAVLALVVASIVPAVFGVANASANDDLTQAWNLLKQQFPEVAESSQTPGLGLPQGYKLVRYINNLEGKRLFLNSKECVDIGLAGSATG